MNSVIRDVNASYRAAWHGTGEERAVPSILPSNDPANLIVFGHGGCNDEGEMPVFGAVINVATGLPWGQKNYWINIATRRLRLRDDPVTEE